MKVAVYWTLTTACLVMAFWYMTPEADHRYVFVYVGLFVGFLAAAVRATIYDCMLSVTVEVLAKTFDKSSVRSITVESSFEETPKA